MIYLNFPDIPKRISEPFSNGSPSSARKWEDCITNYSQIVQGENAHTLTHRMMKPVWQSVKNWWLRASLVAQWLRVRLPMQGTWVWALVREDPTGRGANKPVCHNYWACALEPACHNYWAHVLQLLKPARLEPVLHNKRSDRNEKPAHCKEE